MGQRITLGTRLKSELLWGKKVEMLETVLSLFFPKELTEHFDLKSHREIVDSGSGAVILELTFEEKNLLPDGYSTADYQTKDFLEKTILDVPIRHRPVHLVIRRRRWRHKVSGKVIQRDLSFIASDGRFTTDLVAFLKGGD
jgi:hypothetical protein